MSLTSELRELRGSRATPELLMSGSGAPGNFLQNRRCEVIVDRKAEHSVVTSRVAASKLKTRH